MENKFESLTIFEIQERFPEDNSCYGYLLNLKWANGFVCPYCETINIAIKALIQQTMYFLQVNAKPITCKEYLLND